MEGGGGGWYRGGDQWAASRQNGRIRPSFPGFGGRGGSRAQCTASAANIERRQLCSPPPTAFTARRRVPEVARLTQPDCMAEVCSILLEDHSHETTFRSDGPRPELVAGFTWFNKDAHSGSRSSHGFGSSSSKISSFLLSFLFHLYAVIDMDL